MPASRPASTSGAEAVLSVASGLRRRAALYSFRSPASTVRRILSACSSGRLVPSSIRLRAAAPPRRVPRTRTVAAPPPGRRTTRCPRCLPRRPFPARPPRTRPRRSVSGPISWPCSSPRSSSALRVVTCSGPRPPPACSRSIAASSTVCTRAIRPASTATARLSVPPCSAMRSAIRRILHGCVLWMVVPTSALRADAALSPRLLSRQQAGAFARVLGGSCRPFLQQPGPGWP